MNSDPDGVTADEVADQGDLGGEVGEPLRRLVAHSLHDALDATAGDTAIGQA